MARDEPIIKQASRKPDPYASIKQGINTALLTGCLALQSWCLYSCHTLSINMETEKTQRAIKDEQHEKNFDVYKGDVEKKFIERKTDFNILVVDAKADAEKRIIETRVETERRITEMKTESEKRISEVRVDSDRRFADIQKQLESMNLKLDSILSKGLKP